MCQERVAAVAIKGKREERESHSENCKGNTSGRDLASRMPRKTCNYFCFQ